MHSGYQCKLENIDVVKDVIHQLKEKKFWIATAKQIHDWYLAKDYLEISSQRRGKNRIAVTISNPGERTVSNIVVYVDLNDKADHITIDTEVIGTKKAAYSHKKGYEVLYLYVDDLRQGESRTFYIDYDIVPL